MDDPFEVLRNVLKETPAESGGIFLFRCEAATMLAEAIRLRSIEGAWLFVPSAEKRAAEDEYAGWFPQGQIESRVAEMQALKARIGSNH